MRAFVEKYAWWIMLTALLVGLLIHERSEAAGLTVNPVSVGPGEAAQVAWTADAADCEMLYATAEGASGSWGPVAVTGTETAWMQSSTRFTLTCGTEAVATAAVVVAGVPAPPAPSIAQPSLPTPETVEESEYAAICGPGAEFRTLWRKMPVAPNRLYIGCRDPESLMTYTWFTDTTKADEALIRSWGSYMMRTTTWPYPKGIAVYDVWEAVSMCDRWYLWAENDPAAPKMTRAAKLKQAGC